FFFFSSRRRHTRSDRDWSSDVCSSDLETLCKRNDPQQGYPDFGGHHSLPSLRCRKILRINPMMPSGAPTTNSTSITPSTSTFTSDEMVTVSNCCVVLSRIAPTIGPDQCAVPPISDIASVETE